MPPRPGFRQTPSASGPLILEGRVLPSGGRTPKLCCLNAHAAFILLPQDMKCRIALFLLIGLVAARGVSAGDAAALWSGKVQPLFDIQCVKCHGPIEQKSGLELDSPEAVLKGGDEGAVVVPGEPDQSRLYRYLDANSDPHMPPRKQLTAEERDWVRSWIAAMKSASVKSASGSGISRSFESVTQAIDVLVEEEWKRRGVTPAPAAEDRAWCRRIYLDLIGRIPSPLELEAFLDSPADSRRGEWVDRLLASDEHGVRMRELWDVFLMGRVKRDNHEEHRRKNGWWDFLERSFRENRPWDRTVRAMLVARPDGPGERGASWFLYERRNEHQGIAEAVAPVVYGARIDCAQCHDHPLAREIKQGHYWGMVAAFNRSKNVDGGADVGESAVGGFINFTNLRKESQPALITLLNGGTVEEARPQDGEKEDDSDDRYVVMEGKVRVPKFSRREAFAVAATEDNPLLAQAMVNRLWGVFMGRGLVHPVDEMTARNAPSHPELLAWLAEDFARHDHDIRRVLRGIVLSRAYGLGVHPDGNHAPAEPDLFAETLERPLSAEQIARSWRVAAGLPPNDDTLRRAAVAAMPDVLPREYNATFQQAQFLSYSPALSGILKPEPGSSVGRLAGLPDDPSRVREAFLAVLGRLPDDEERERVGAFLAERSEQPAEASRDLLWALMTGAEFLTMP